MQLNKKLLLERVEKWMSNIYWTDVNIHKELLIYEKPIEDIFVFDVQPQSKITFAQVISQESEFKPCSVGQSFGPSWSTKWFRIRFEVPTDLNNKKHVIALIWDSNSEALLYDNEGNAIQAYTGGGGSDRRDSCFLFKVGECYDKKATFWVEMACNAMFGNGNNGLIQPPDDNRQFALSKVCLAELNEDVGNLYWDIKVLYDLVDSLPEHHPTSGVVLHILTHILNNINLKNGESIKRSRDLAAGVLHHQASFNSSATVDSQPISERSEFRDASRFKLDHEIYAVGHCHIDTAWLWPYSETRRKIKRSWVTQSTLMKRYPNYNFVTSQTVHWEWLKEDDPLLFSELKRRVADRKFLPVGGSYVEFDANIPSGESMIRQLLYGQEFFMNEFAVHSPVFWLPDDVLAQMRLDEMKPISLPAYLLSDTFGYSGQLPQILCEFDIPYFLSQKLSWNLFNKFPHSTFEWEGIDGSRVIAHFPPADTYNSSASVADVLKSSENHKSAMVSNRSMLLFGHGDGGGGPAVSHLEQLIRMKGCDALPVIHTDRSPDQFFEDVRKDHKASAARGIVPARWIGELYLELHQGTLTSQANIKQQNRRCEASLRAVESLLVIAQICLKGCHHNQDVSAQSELVSTWRDEIKLLWKELLLNQFHDVLPGSSIAMVYEDSNRMLSNVLARCQELCEAIGSELLETIRSEDSQPLAKHYFNATGFSREVSIKGYGTSIVMPFSFHFPSTVPSCFPVLTLPRVCLAREGEEIEVENMFMKLKFSNYGGILSLVDKRVGSGREVVPPSDDSGPTIANRMVLYEDIPFFWDAWDTMPYHLMRGRTVNAPRTTGTARQSSPAVVEILSQAELVGIGTFDMVGNEFDNSIGIRFTLTGWGDHADTKLVQTLLVTSNSPQIDFHQEIHWFENRKLLKVEFPLAIRSSMATYEIQNGLIKRPTHSNTPFDAAMFEVCGHKFADLSEDDYGVALLSDSKYGYSCRESTLCMSLLRAPKAPDPNCDMGIHRFRYALLPHVGSSLLDGGVVRAAHLMNSPLVPILPMYSKPPEVDVSVTIQPPGLLAGSPSIKAVEDVMGKGWLKLSPESGLVIDTLKLSEKSLDHIIVRLYEPVGRRGVLNLKISDAVAALVKRVVRCQANENELSDIFLNTDGSLCLEYLPFKIYTIKIVL